MELNNLFLYSVSIFSILASILIVMIGVFSVIFMVRANRIADLIEKLTQTINSTVSETGESVKKTIDSIEQLVKGLFTFATIKKTVLDIINAIKSQKGEQNGKRNKKE